MRLSVFIHHVNSILSQVDPNRCAGGFVICDCDDDGEYIRARAPIVGKDIVLSAIFEKWDPDYHIEMTVGYDSGDGLVFCDPYRFEVYGNGEGPVRTPSILLKELKQEIAEAKRDYRTALAAAK